MATSTTARMSNSVTRNVEREAEIKTQFDAKRKIESDNAFAAQRVEELRAAGVYGTARLPAEEAPTASRPMPEQGGLGERVETQGTGDQQAALLAGLQARYRVVDNEYRLRDEQSSLVFVDKGNKISTLNSDIDTARAMVDLAMAKGWTALTLGGSAEFKANAWLYATTKGLDVLGYTPTALDQAKLKELQADVAEVVSRATPKAAPQNRESPPDLAPLHKEALKAMEVVMRRSSPEYPNGHTDAQIQAAQTAAQKQWTSERVFVGKVVGSGPAPYEFNDNNKPSFYVVIEDPKGQKHTIWGVDLPRALEESGTNPNDDVVVAFKGAKPVTVPVEVKGPGGKSLQDFVETVRNTWEVKALHTLSEKAQQTALAQTRQLRAVPSQKSPGQTQAGPVRAPIRMGRGR